MAERVKLMAAAVILGLTMLGPGLSITNASAGASVPASSGWIYHPLGMSLSNMTTRIVQGTPAPSGVCAYSSRGTSGSLGVSYVEIETGFNPTTCQVQLTSGTSSASSAATANAATPADSSVTYSANSSQPPGRSTPPPAAPGRPTNLSASGPSGAAAAATSNWTAYQNNHFRDPAYIVVTAQEQWINWTTNGSCVTNWSFSNKFSWHTGTGWVKNYGYNPYFAACSLIDTYPYSGFSNGTFCWVAFGITGTTYNYYGQNAGSNIGDDLAGRVNGTYYWDYYDVKSGVCNTLLSHVHSDHR